MSTISAPFGLRRRIADALHGARAGDRGSRVVEGLLLTLIFLNVLAVILETVPAIQQRFRAEFLAFELISVFVFSVEYLARIWSAPGDPRYRQPVRGRLRWALTPMALIDLLAILPFYLPFLGIDLRFARALRLTRVFRIAKLGRYVGAISLFARVIRGKREELVLTSMLVALLIVLASSLMYFAEHAAQPDGFSSIPASMWWAVATVTTVGYGDLTPVTGMGRLLGGFIAILGIGLFAIPTAILGSGFIAEMENRRGPRRCPHCGGEL